MAGTKCIVNSAAVIAVLEMFFPSSDRQVETFEDGCVVSDYAQMFAKEKPLNGNAGMWEWGVNKILGKTYAKVTVLITPRGCTPKAIIR